MPSANTETNEHLLRLAWERMPVAVWTVDASGTITSWNREAEHLTGRKAEETLGKPYAEVLPGLGDHPDPRRSHGGLAGAGLGETRNREGQPLYLLCRARFLVGPEDPSQGWVESAIDAAAMNTQSAEVLRFSANPPHTSRFPGIIGDHPLMREVFHRIQLAAASNVSVFITGESGTGKELVAEAIHTLSDRSDGNFVKVNCSAIPETLLESELFGHVRGAFTGANYDKVGRFELANGGTIFLDEIGDISPLIQVKLLRVLQEKTFERVGESESMSTDVRIICATNRDITSLVDRNLFREDLFYRINVFPVHVPPLRARSSDIQLLVDHFVAKIREETGKNISSITSDALTLLKRFQWPGNVRQLQNAIEHAFVTAQGDTLSIFDLPPEIREGIFNPPKTQADPHQDRKNRERERILAALRQTNWNRTRASKLVGISRVTLWKRIKEYGLQKDSE